MAGGQNSRSYASGSPGISGDPNPSAADKDIPNVIIIGDPGRDMDDEHAILLSVFLHGTGQINLLGYVANLFPSKLRALLAKGTYNECGMETRVGYGREVLESLKSGMSQGEKNEESRKFLDRLRSRLRSRYSHEALIGELNAEDRVKAPFPDLKSIPYLAKEDEIEDGQKMIIDLLEKSEDESVTIVLHSAFSDLADVFRNDAHKDLFNRKVKNVTMMAGAEVTDDGKVVPDTSHNITFDRESAELVFKVLSELGTPSTILSRHAAYQAPVPFSIYDKLREASPEVGGGFLKRQQRAFFGISVPGSLWSRQKNSFEHLWVAANKPVSERNHANGDLPERCNRQWFVDLFCSGVDPNLDGKEKGLAKSFTGFFKRFFFRKETQIWDHIETFIAYDPYTLIAAVEPLRELYFSSESVDNFKIIGLDSETEWVKDPEGLIKFLENSEVKGLDIANRSGDSRQSGRSM